MRHLKHLVVGLLSWGWFRILDLQALRIAADMLDPPEEEGAAALRVVETE